MPIIQAINADGQRYVTVCRLSEIPKHYKMMKQKGLLNITVTNE